MGTPDIDTTPLGIIHARQPVVRQCVYPVTSFDVTWSDEEWEAAFSSPDWGLRVAEALRRYVDCGGFLFERVQLMEAGTEVDSDGTSVLLAVYHHPFWPERTGLRRRLDRRPMTDAGAATPEDAVAAEIAIYDISEPLGRYYELLVEDDRGVWWWGDGYPDLTEQPDPRA